MEKAEGNALMVPPSGPMVSAIIEAARVARIAVVVAGIDGPEPVMLFASQAIADMSGYTEEELLTLRPLDLLAPETLPLAREALAERLAGAPGAVSYEYTMIRKDRTRLPIEVTTANVEIEGRAAVISFVVDLTERTHAKEALHHAEASFQKLMDIAPESVGIVRDGCFVYVNAAYVEMLGYDSPEDLVGRSLYDVVNPEHHTTLRAREIVHTTTGERLPTVVYTARRRDGSELLVEVSAAPLVFEGKPAVLSIGRDVTERKRMEAQLEQADRLAALGTLAAGVAHEVNNPLSYLLLNLEWVSRQLPELARDPSRLPELSAMMAEARQGAERVVAIVRELRAFSRADGETRRLVDLAGAVNAAIKIAAHEIKHRARVTTSFEESLPVWANEARIEQVLLNLLLNASQAMPEADADKNEIRVTVRPAPNDRTIVEISDNGVGIPPETIRRIFDPFFTTKPVGVGTGLGLSICHGIVTSLGGQISVRSEVGEGTTFRIVLPSRRFEDEPRSSSEPASTEVRSGRRGKVLVVDDEVAIAHTMRDLLQADHDVTAVVSGRAALAAIEADAEYDVVFCDLMMPSFTGMDLFEAVRTKRPGMEERMVFMTGGAFTTRAAEFLAAVKNRHLEKPFSLSTIERLVRDAVKSRTRESAGQVA